MLPPAVSRLSRVWFPSGGIAAAGVEDGHAKLIRAGFLRPSHSGIFHMLPLGRRVQNKIEGLVASHMENVLAASRVSLSSISAQSLWEKSGRFENIASELFRFSDRKDVAYLLSPTHEEEITALVARTVKSYKELPLRLFQITPKYRDEFRPRHGLLRGREFIMKDLYTFDSSVDSALKTYSEVRQVYSKIFAEMKLPVLPAKASSGDMGGDLSHEYHLPTHLGEDRVISCDACDYVANEEVAESVATDECVSGTKVKVWRGITKDRTKLINVWYPEQTRPADGSEVRVHVESDINLAEVKSVVPDLDAGVEDAGSLWSVATAAGTAAELIHVVDRRIPSGVFDEIVKDSPAGVQKISVLDRTVGGDMPLNLLRIQTGDKCPECKSGHLHSEKAIELGHTFFLGTRYSEPLGAVTSTPTAGQTAHMQMGCYGIGISRIMGAVAEHLADKKGLNWPVAIAPFSCVIIGGKDAGDEDLAEVHSHILNAKNAESKYLDPVLDDRQKPLPWKLTDADIIGYPIIVLLGREWLASRRVEVQSRQLGFKDIVELGDLPSLISRLHADL
ncbi:proline--tRNA ligase [Cladorrhinum sp. PSN259]|nr:proline--tRNA ligase [Cladorrhinum sp. PSN259]